MSFEVIRQQLPLLPEEGRAAAYGSSSGRSGR